MKSNLHSRIEPDADPADDPRVMALAQEYLKQLESGRTPNRKEFVNRYPDLSDVVSECLDGIELAHGAGLAMNAEPAESPESTQFSVADTAAPLGDFRIIREIGRGGMGVVYEAKQLSLDRRVALKVLPFAAGLDAKHLQRFKTEAYAAAQLHHTNIVPVYAVGCERGTYFYAMQIIDGQPLDQRIRELRGDPERPRTDSTINLRRGPTNPFEDLPKTHPTKSTGQNRDAYRGIAKLAVQVADALEYAHEAGVIHRDIKPANLLLDAKNNIWLTDFGLAHVAADVSLTRTGDVFGTLRYMSPEQAAGARLLVDQRTDVYSLGATLYELLTLQPIFPDTDRQALLHKILHEEPKRLRQHDANIPVELETIVMKATAKAPVDRYATAGAMAEDLRRFLDNRSILARRPTVWDRTRKWLRRHPSVVIAAVVLLAFGVLGFGISTALVARQKGKTDSANIALENVNASLGKERDKTAAAYLKEKERAKEAEQRFQLARKAADEMIRFANEELSDHPTQQSLRRKLLESALVYYQEFTDLRKNDPSARKEIDETRNRISGILGDLAVMQGGMRHLILSEPAVQDDLELNREKRDAIREMVERITGKRGNFYDDLYKLDHEQRSKLIVERVKLLDGELNAILNPAQNKRLGQIALQMRGLQAFQETEVIAALKLTQQQREKIRLLDASAPMPIHGEFMRRPGGHPPGSPGFGGPGGGGGPPGGRGGFGPPDDDGSPPERPGGPFGKGGRGGGGGPPGFGGMGGPEREAQVKQIWKDTLGVLSAAQLEKWRELIGAPYSGPPVMMMRSF
jgi:serine/threonine protein kinase